MKDHYDTAISSILAFIIMEPSYEANDRLASALLALERGRMYHKDGVEVLKFNEMVPQ